MASRGQDQRSDDAGAVEDTPGGGRGDLTVSLRSARLQDLTKIANLWGGIWAMCGILSGLPKSTQHPSMGSSLRAYLALWKGL